MINRDELLNAWNRTLAGGQSKTLWAEADPSGKNPHEPGSKLDRGKPRVGMVMNQFPRALWEVSRVGTFGADKYTEGGWLTVPNGVARYEDAGYRHKLKRAMGESVDQDSGLLHLAHEAWNALAVLELAVREGSRFVIPETWSDDINKAYKNAVEAARGKSD